ncbi:MAG: hypothetical protein ACTS43_01580 [Candidatus Hodgkinia cicadicola]
MNERERTKGKTEAELPFQRHRTDSNEIEESSIKFAFAFASVQLIQQIEQMLEPMFRGKSIISHCECKTIEIRSNIGSNDLNTKLNLIRRFIRKGFKVNVLAKFSRFATASNAYESFVNSLEMALRQVGTSVLGPTHFTGGSVVFCVIGMRSQSC